MHLSFNTYSQKYRVFACIPLQPAVPIPPSQQGKIW